MFYGRFMSKRFQNFPGGANQRIKTILVRGKIHCSAHLSNLDFMHYRTIHQHLYLRQPGNGLALFDAPTSYLLFYQRNYDTVEDGVWLGDWERAIYCN